MPPPIVASRSDLTEKIFIETYLRFQFRSRRREILRETSPEDIALEMDKPLKKGYMWIPDDQKLWVGNLSKRLYGPELTRWLNLKGFETPIPLKVVPE